MEFAVKLFIEIQVRDFTALAEFESQANAIMQDYQGCIVQAFELEHHDDNSGIEIHIVEFASEELFSQYQQDRRLVELAELRQAAISEISAKRIGTEKTY